MVKKQISREPKTVIKMPVQELWADQRLISTIRLRYLTASEIGTFLQTENIRFVVADLGHELFWVPNNERFTFWKNQAKSHLTTWENNNDLADFPDGYFYIASEWRSYNGLTIILLEKYHSPVRAKNNEGL
jgi:hypothetical protein